MFVCGCSCCVPVAREWKHLQSCGEIVLASPPASHLHQYLLWWPAADNNSFLSLEWGNDRERVIVGNNMSKHNNYLHQLSCSGHISWTSGFLTYGLEARKKAWKRNFRGCGNCGGTTFCVDKLRKWNSLTQSWKFVQFWPKKISYLSEMKTKGVHKNWSLLHKKRENINHKILWRESFNNRQTRTLKFSSIRFKQL